jgi:hypothetical protein
MIISGVHHPSRKGLVHLTEKVLTGVCARKQLLGQGVADRPKTFN